jgi:hypothetical protein
VCDFWIEFDELCPATQRVWQSPVVVNSGTQVQLHWGERLTFPLPKESNFKVTFDSYDGTHGEYSSPYSRPGAYISVGVEGDSLVLSAAEPSNL